MGRLVAADGLLVFIMKPVDHLNQDPNDGQAAEKILKRHMYGLLRKYFPRKLYTALLSAFAGSGGNRLFTVHRLR